MGEGEGAAFLLAWDFDAGWGVGVVAGQAASPTSAPEIVATRRKRALARLAAKGTVAGACPRPGLGPSPAHATNPPMRALALDVGTRTIGLALSDPDGIVASAWETLRRSGEAADVTELVARIEDREVGHVVVGLPLELDGREGRRARRVLRLADVLRERLDARPGDPIPVVTWDERFSTAAAERVLKEADMSRARRAEKIDAVAAQVILQGWLDSRRDAEERP